MSEAERLRSLVTSEQIRYDFASIERRAQPGVYAGFGPRKLYELEMEALHHDPDCNVLWAAASGSNLSVDREILIDAGGFVTQLTINEHRELALRLCRRGLRMAATQARSYHMLHRSGWRDPLADTEWLQIFYAAYPLPEVALLPFLWESLSNSPALSAEARITSLAELSEAAYTQRDVRGMHAVQEAHRQRRSVESIA